MTRTRTFFHILFLITVWICAFGSPLFAQDDHDHDREPPAYQRPQARVYRSLAEANTQPDSVQILELKGKKLKTVPADVFRYKNLLVLDLSRNKIKTIPDSLYLLTQLEELNLTANKISAVPAALGKSTSIRKLALNRNVITELPPEIGEMNNLEVLELWDNELGDLPDEIHNLKKLRKLELRGILFSEETQKRFMDLLPHTEIYMSPACGCKN